MWGTLAVAAGKTGELEQSEKSLEEDWLCLPSSLGFFPSSQVLLICGWLFFLQDELDFSPVALLEMSQRMIWDTVLIPNSRLAACCLENQYQRVKWWWGRLLFQEACNLGRWRTNVSKTSFLPRCNWKALEMVGVVCVREGSYSHVDIWTEALVSLETVFQNSQDISPGKGLFLHFSRLVVYRSQKE